MPDNFKALESHLPSTAGIRLNHQRNYEEMRVVRKNFSIKYHFTRVFCLQLLECSYLGTEDSHRHNEIDSVEMVSLLLGKFHIMNYIPWEAFRPFRRS